MKAAFSSLLFALVFTLSWAARTAAAPNPAQSTVIDGELVYKTNCTRCHNTPPSLNERQTRVVVSHMRVRANLNARDANAVLLYLAENARSK
jgi:hypothetical protein